MAGYSKPEPLYGAPRGNRVMKAKRVTGPSAFAILRTHVALERCGHKGCKGTVLLTVPNPIGKKRYCAEHVPQHAYVPPSTIYAESPAAMLPKQHRRADIQALLSL